MNEPQRKDSGLDSSVESEDKDHLKLIRNRKSNESDVLQSNGHGEDGDEINDETKNLTPMELEGKPCLDKKHLDHHKRCLCTFEELG